MEWFRKIMNAIINFLVTILIISPILLFLFCSFKATKVRQAEQFQCERRVTVYNARTDTIILECEGYLDVSNNEHHELVITVKTGASTYKKNYIYLNSYTLYVVEDITGTHTDPYHYKMYFHTSILPDVEIVP